MNKARRAALAAVPGQRGRATLALAAVVSFATVMPGPAAQGSEKADPHRGFVSLVSQPPTPYVPLRVSVSAPQRPALWTVRSRFDDLIHATARRHDIDPALVKAIVQAESAFDPEAVSRCGARGLMQVLPTTASRFSIKNLSDPRQNLRAGVLYLKHLLELFDGDVIMAVAAYNAGPNTVRRHRGVPPYRETRRYLTKVLGLREAYADPARRS